MGRQRYYFHAAPPEARDRIAHTGLRPGSTASYGPPAVYLFRWRTFAEDYTSRPMDVWRVDTAGLWLYPDPEDPTAAVFSERPVGRERLRFLGTYFQGEEVP